MEASEVRFWASCRKVRGWSESGSITATVIISQRIKSDRV